MVSDAKAAIGEMVKIHDWCGIVQEVHFDAHGSLSIIQVQTVRNLFRGHGPEYIDTRMMSEAVQPATLADLEQEIKTRHQLLKNVLARMLNTALQEVVLKIDIPEKGLKKGDIATIVEHHSANSGEDGYSLEVFNALGDTITVVTVAESSIMALSANEVLNARPHVIAT